MFEGFLLQVARTSYINQVLTSPTCKSISQYAIYTCSIFLSFDFNILTFFSILSRELLKPVYQFGHQKNEPKNQAVVYGVIQKVRLLWRGKGLLKKRAKTNRGRGVQTYLYVRSVKKIT